MLDQMICLCDNDLSVDIIKNAFGIVDDSLFNQLLDLIGKKDGLNMLKLLNEILDRGVSVDDYINGFNNFLQIFIKW